MKRGVSIVILAQDAIQRQGLLSILRGVGFPDVQACDTIGDLCSADVPEGKQVLLLLDWQKDGELPADMIQRLRAKHPDARLVLLANEYRDSLMLQAVHSGADAFLLSHVEPEVLVKSLELVLLGERVFPVKTFQKLAQPLAFANEAGETGPEARDLLSAREIEVLGRLTAGQANKVIARDCGITESTVKVHVKAILRKIQAKNRTQAAVWARRHGVPEPAPISVEPPAPPQAIDFGSAQDKAGVRKPLPSKF